MFILAFCLNLTLTSITLLSNKKELELKLIAFLRSLLELICQNLQVPFGTPGTTTLFNILKNKKLNKHIQIKSWRVRCDYWLAPYNKGTIWKLAQIQK